VFVVIQLIISEPAHALHTVHSTNLLFYMAKLRLLHFTK